MDEEEKRLYVSFSKLVALMKTGKVTPEDLDGALFYFSCGKSYLRTDFVANPDIRIIFNLGREGEDLEGALTTYNRIRIEAFAAEDDGRAYLREKEDLSFKDLNELLERNKIDTSSVKEFEEQRYSSGVVRREYKSLQGIVIN